MAPEVILWSEEDVYNVYNLEIFTMGMNYFNKSVKKSDNSIVVKNKKTRISVALVLWG